MLDIFPRLVRLLALRLRANQVESLVSSHIYRGLREIRHDLGFCSGVPTGAIALQRKK